VFGMRFDMRLAHPEQARTQYRAALDMAEWAETRGGLFVVLSEHHGSADGYLPSPNVFAGAMAARTTTTFITVAAAMMSFEQVRQYGVPGFAGTNRTRTSKPSCRPVAGEISVSVAPTPRAIVVAIASASAS